MPKPEVRAEEVTVDTYCAQSTHECVIGLRTIGRGFDITLMDPTEPMTAQLKKQALRLSMSRSLIQIAGTDTLYERAVETEYAELNTQRDSTELTSFESYRAFSTAWPWMCRWMWNPLANLLAVEASMRRNCEKIFENQ